MSVEVGDAVSLGVCVPLCERVGELEGVAEEEGIVHSVPGLAVFPEQFTNMPTL